MKTDNPYEPANISPRIETDAKPPLRWLMVIAPYIAILAFLVGGEFLVVALFSKRTTLYVVVSVVTLILMAGPMAFVFFRSGLTGLRASPIRSGVVAVLSALFLILHGIQVFRLLIA